MHGIILQTYNDLKKRYNINVLLVFVLLGHLVWIIVPPFIDFASGSWATKPHHSDFMSFWSAAQFALEGNPLEAYNTALMKQAQITHMGYDDPKGILDWLFPPIAFFIVLPFGLINYSLARFVWMAVTTAAYAFVCYKIIPRKTAVLAALAAPALAYNCIFTQTGALTAFLLGGMVICLPKRQILAGILIGVLTFKPQLGVLAPFALIAGGYWRAFFSASLTAVFLVMAATLVFSFASWEAFQAALERTVDINLVSATSLHGIMQTPYSFIQTLTGSLQAAITIQIIIGILSVINVIYIWYHPYSDELKGAVFLVTTALSSFYFQIYEFPILIVASLLIGRLGLKRGSLPYENDLMVLAAIIPYFYQLSEYPIGLLSIGIMIYVVFRRFKQEYADMTNVSLPSRV